MTLEEARDRYLFDLERGNRSKITIRNYWFHLRYFIRWVKGTSGDITIQEVTQDHILDYGEHLLTIDKKDQSDSYRIDRMRNVKRFFSYLKRTSLILINPCEGLPAIKDAKPLPKQLLKVEELKALLEFEPQTSFEYLQKAVFLTAFAGGLRRRELVNLTIYDVNLRESSIRVNEGKGQKDRIVPIGRQCLDFLKTYIEIERPKVLKRRREDSLFLSTVGTPLSYSTIAYLFRTLGERFNSRLTCHLLRHQSSVELVRNGMNLRYLQEYLNHSHLQTVEIYTRLAPTDLKKAHEKADPRKRITLTGSSLEGNRGKSGKVAFFKKKAKKSK